MSTEGSVGVEIKITDNFDKIVTGVSNVVTAITTLDSKIGTATRTINVKALLVTTDFDKKIAEVEAKEHTIKIKVNAQEIEAMVAGAVTGGTPHTIRTTVDLANVKEIINTTLNAEHQINVTVNSAGLETKVAAAMKNKSYPVQIDFTPDSAVGNSLSGISSAMKDITRLTGEINKLTKTALGDLNAQMATYFNDLNHIIDLTNKVAATVETNENKKAEAADKAAKRMEDAAQKLADKTAELENKKATQAKKSADDATALAEKIKTDTIAKAQELADKQKEISAKAEAAILKDKQESFAKYLKGTEAVVEQRIGIEEKQVKALKDINQKVEEDFKNRVKTFLDGQNSIVEGYRKEIQAKLEATKAEYDLLEARKKSAIEAKITQSNLGAGTFQNKGLTGSKTQGMDTGFPIALGGTGKPSNQVEQAVSDAANMDKQIAALRKYNAEYEQAYKMQYDMEKKIHNDINAAYAENTARDRKMFLDREAAENENVARERRYILDYEAAYKMRYDIEKRNYLDIQAAYEENTARDRRMFLDREAANKENYEREKRNYMMLRDAYKENEKIDKQKRMDRGKAIYSGDAIMTSRQDIANLREYVAEHTRLHDTLGMVQNSIGMVTNALMQMGVYLSARQLMDYADHWMHFISTVKVAMHSMIDTMQRLSGETDILTKDQQKLLVESKIDEVFKISQETRTSIEGTATLFGRMSRAAEAMGMSNKVAMTLTKELGQALMISGLSTNSARGALLQLEQALGGVIVRGQEFKSVNDGLPIVMQTIVKHYNEAKVSIEALNLGYERGTEAYEKYMAANNKVRALTMPEGRTLMLKQEMMSAVSAEALLLGQKELDELSKDVEKTFEQSFNYIGNAFSKYIGTLNEASGASKSFSEIAKVIGDNFDAIGNVVLGVGTALGTYMVAIGLATVATKLFAGALSTNIYATTLAVIVALGVEMYSFAQTSKDTTSEANVAWQAFWKTFDESDNPMLTIFKLIAAEFEGLKNTVLWMVDKVNELKGSVAEDSMLGKIGSGVSKVLHIASPVAGAAYDALSGANSEKGSFGDSYDKNKELIKQNLKNEELQTKAKLLGIDKTLEGLEKRIEAEEQRLKVVGMKESTSSFGSIAMDKVARDAAHDAMSNRDKYIDTAINKFQSSFITELGKSGTNEKKITLDDLLKMEQKNLRATEPNTTLLAIVYDEWKKQKEALVSIEGKAYDLKLEQDKINAAQKEQDTFKSNLPNIQEGNLVYMEGQQSKIEDTYKKLGVTLKKTMVESYVESVNDINTKSAEIKPRVAPPSSKEVLALIEKYSKEFNVDSNLVKGVIQQESAWKPNAHNKSGASGLMQVMPANFSAYGITDPSNVDQNLKAGIKILSEDIKSFGGNVKLALAAYNYGGGNVRKVDKDISRMPAETQNYIPTVMGYAKEFAAGKTGRLSAEDSADLKEKATEVKKVMTEAITPDFSTLSQPLRKLMDEELKLVNEMQAKKDTIKTKEEQQNFELDKKRLTSIEGEITRQVDLEKTTDAKFEKEIRQEMSIDKIRNKYGDSMKNFKEEQLQSAKMASMISEKGAYAVDELNQMAAANFENADAAKQLEANLREILDAELKRSVYNEDANIQAQNELEKKQKILGIVEQINDASAAAKQSEKLGKDAESSVKNVTANAYKQVDKLKAENQSIFAATGTGKAFAVADKRMELDKAVGNILDPEAKKKFQAEADALLKSMQLKLDVELRVANIEEFKTGLSTLTQSLGEDLGKVGEALTGIASHFADIALSNEKLAGQAEMEKNAYEEKLKTITGTDEKANKQKLELTEAYNKEKEKIERKGTKAQIDGFANIAGAASTMFGEQTRGRKALHALEITLHATSMAMTLVETAANVASGAAKFFAQSGWAGFAGVAAMLALMGTLGYAIGGGGGSSKPQDTSAPETKSTGSVFGDKESSSKSVENIVTTLNDIHYREYDALLSIGDSFKMLSKDVNGAVILAVNQQGGFAGSTKQASASALNPAGSTAMIGAGLAGSVALGATGALSQVGLLVGAQLVNAGATSLGIGMSTAAASSAAMSTTVGTALGAGSGAMASALGGAVLGLAGGLVFAALQYGLGKLLGIGKTKFEVIGAGIMTKATDVIIDGAAKSLMVYDYSKIKQTTKGWFSDTVKIYDIVNGINSNMTSTFTSIFVNFKNIIGGMAKELNISEFFDKAFTIPKMKISLKGLKSEEINKKITDTLNTVMDDIVTSVQNGFLTQFQRMGEGMLETFNRVATDALVVKATFKNMGMDISTTGFGLITFSEALVDVFESSASAKDGLKNFVKTMNDLYKVATTGGQKTADTAGQLAAKITALNTQSTTITTKSTGIALTSNFANDVADLKASTTAVVADVAKAAKALPAANLKTLAADVNKDIRGKDFSNDVLLKRIGMAFGTDSDRYKTAEKNPNALKLTTADILKVTKSDIFDNTQASVSLSAYRNSSSGESQKIADKTLAYAKALDASTLVLTKQETAINNLQKATDVDNPAGMDRYATGMSTNTVANQTIISGLINKVINDKTPPNTSALMSKTISVTLPTLPTDPTELTQAVVLAAQKELTAAINTMGNITKGLTSLQNLTTPTTALADLSKLDKKGSIDWLLKGKNSQFNEMNITKEQLMHLTTSQLNANVAEKVMGEIRDKTGAVTGYDQTKATYTQDKTSGPFYTELAKIIKHNDEAAEQLRAIKKSPTGVADFVTKTFGTAETLGGKPNFDKLVEQVNDIVKISDAVARDDAFASLKGSYTDLNKTVATYQSDFASIAQNFGDTLAFTKSIADIQESYLSKVTTELETKNRAYAESLKDLNSETDISSLLTKQTTTAVTTWIGTLNEERKAYLGIKEVTSDVVDEQGNQVKSLAITEMALKAFDNSVTSLSGSLQAALTALKNFQSSISDWVRNQKTTNVGNTKSQMDEASRQFDTLMLKIKNPAVSAEDKNLAMSKITGSADALLNAVRNYYGTSKAGADITSEIIKQMDTLPDSLTTQELMLGELQKIKDNTAVLPTFVGMTQGSTDTIDTLSKAIAAAMALDKSNPSLANTAILDAKANIQLVLQKAVVGATGADAVFLNNLVSAIGGDKGLSATIDAVVNAKLGTTTTEDVLNTLKTSFAGLEVEIEKVKLNPTEANIKQMQADIDNFKVLTMKINGNVESLKLNPDDPVLRRQLQESLDEMNDFTAKVTGIDITSTAKRLAVGDLKSTFANSTFKVNPSVSNGSIIEMMSTLREKFAALIAKVNVTDNPVATATLKESFRKSFGTIDSKVFTSLNQDSKLAVLSAMDAAFDHIEATVDSTLNESKKATVLTSLNRAFGIIPSVVTANINESARIAAVEALKVSFKTITTGIAPMVNEDLKLKAQGILDNAFDTVEATINSTVGEATKKTTFNALKNAFSTITASISSDVNETSQGLALTALEKGFKAVNANIVSDLDDGAKYSVANELKTAFGKMTDIISVELDPKTMDKALTAIDRAFGSIDVLISSNVEPKTKQAAIKEITAAFGTIKTLVESDVDEESKYNAIAALERGFATVEAVAYASISPASKTAAVNSLKNALSGIQALINDVALNPTDTNIRQLNDKIKKFGNLTAQVETTISGIAISTSTEAQLARDISAIDDLMADVGLGVKSGAATDLNSQIAALTSAIKNIKVTLKIDFDAVSDEAVSRVEGIQDISQDPMVFKIQVPQISTATVDNLTNALKESTAEAAKMITTFDSMLSNAQQVQSAIDIFANGNTMIAAYIPLAGEVRGREGYQKLADLTEIEAQMQLTTTEKQRQTYTDFGQDKIKTEKDALKLGSQLYYDLQTGSSKYNIALSYVEGYNSTHTPDIPQKVHVLDGAKNEESYAAGAVLGKNPKTDANNALAAYNRALAIIKSSSDEYYKLIGYNQGGQSPSFFAMGGAFTNGIVNTPTAFNMGVMGEAGPEAIMPLVQTSGGLGVRAIPAANDNNNNSEEELREVKKQNQILMAQNAILQEGFKQLISVNTKQADSLDNIETTNRRAAA
jgi:tape measure domain-containing protein